MSENISIVCNRVQERPILPLPQGIELRAGSPNSMPDYLYGLGYQQSGVTNETLLGIKERAHLAKGKYGEISAFAGVGNPIKTIIQAAILKPSEYLGFIDISGTNIQDAVLLASALRSGYTTLHSYLQSTEGKEILETLQKIIPNRLEHTIQSDIEKPRVLKNELIKRDSIHFYMLDQDLQRTLSTMDITTDDAINAMKKVKRISIRLDNIKSSEAFTEFVEMDGRVIVDTSNIPLYPTTVPESKGGNLTMFYALAAKDESKKQMGVPASGFGKAKNVENYFWQYPYITEQKKENIGMPVGMSPYLEYKNISRYIDDAQNEW
ncbi:MAG TPA: hypothetical protein VLF89_05740 [Candidatus Saccharimonadales bacterium]|nr:hypothetical protein [Candidatus Saccharimonadales bacterium]